MKHKLLLIYAWFVRTLTYFLPDHPLIMRIRGGFYSVGMIRCGCDFQVSSSVILRNLENIYVGNNVYLAPNVVVNAIDKITLSDEVMVGFNTVLVSGNHSLWSSSYRYGKSNKTPIFIGKGSWVAANCTVIAGAKIGSSTLVAANSAVIGDCTETGIYAGVPVKKIKCEKT